MVQFSAISRSGSRPENEDSVGMARQENRFCFALADGLGGHGCGEVASKIAVETAKEEFAGEEEHLLERSFEKAQENILRQQQENRRLADMKTTMVVVNVEEEYVRWGHIGDSRLYFFRNGRIAERTLDHSVPQMLVSIGEIKEKQIRHHPDRNRLLRVLGAETDELRYQLSQEIPRESRTAFLLCSDGFWELILEKKMESTLKRADTPAAWLEAMEKIVEKNGRNKEMDNYSAIAVWID